MPESLGEKSFPLVTFILATVMLAVFLFSMNQVIDPTSKTQVNGTCEITCPNTCESYFGNKICAEADYFNCNCIIPRLNLFENFFGFTPKKLSNVFDVFHMFTTFATYEFTHVSFEHLFFNIVFLLIAGLAVEEKLGKGIFLTVFFVSGFIAVIFDIIGRILTSVLFYGQIAIFSSPFIGASGAIFGLIGIASLINPEAKIPFALNFLLVVALIASFQPFATLYQELQTNLGELKYILITGVVVVVLLSIFLFVFSIPPIYVALIIFLISSLGLIIFRIPTSTSLLGHLGGVIGGILAFFLFGKKEE